MVGGGGAGVVGREGAVAGWGGMGVASPATACSAVCWLSIVKQLRMRMAWKMARKSALRVAGRWVAVSGVGSGWLVSGCGRIVDISG